MLGHQTQLGLVGEPGCGGAQGGTDGEPFGGPADALEHRPTAGEMYGIIAFLAERLRLSLFVLQVQSEIVEWLQIFLRQQRIERGRIEWRRSPTCGQVRLDGVPRR